MQSDTILTILVQEENLHCIYLVTGRQHGCGDQHVVIVEDGGTGSHWLSIDIVFRNFDSTEVEEKVLCWHLLYVELDLYTAGEPFAAG